MGGLQSTERSLSVTASKGLSALRAAPDLCCAVNQRLTSVVREIRTLRSVGAGGSAPGDPVLQGKFLRSTHQERVRRCGLASQVPRARGGIVPEESRALSGREFAALRAAPIASSSTATVQCRAPHMSVRVLVIRCCFTYPV